ncbi:hypothetical protein KSP39_PZI018482 [Platanthera zijinensis]|uniref:Uncharacterized protein n=1 Tax=Platanthera zijinensis TaxID=2320716 RepID=A0AAP0FYC8_9ASPA
MPESVAAIDSNESLRRFTFEPTDHFSVQSSTEFSEIRSGVSPVDEQKSGLFQIPSIKPQGVLSQILFDVCVPKNIEGWDIKADFVPELGSSAPPFQSHQMHQTVQVVGSGGKFEFTATSVVF